MERKQKLYDLLLSQPNHWFTQKEICDNISGYTFKDRKNDKCSAIRADKNEINADRHFEKIITMKNYCFKIATKEEYIAERNAHIRRLKEQVKIIKDMDYKNRINNSFDLLLQEFISSFNENED